MPSAPQAVTDLIERFAHNIDLYHRPEYNETQVRREFIDPLFEALGWDVENREGASPRYQDVVHEYVVRIGRAVRSPDYCFRVGSEPKFFVEAKKPAVDIRYDIHPAYQLRRYSWSAKLPFSVLTDFEEFSVYEGRRVRPKPTDKASTARVLYVTYQEYPDRWEEIASIFSKEAVRRGDYDRYAETTRGKRGTEEVDKAFLREIESWRTLLARNIALRNTRLGRRELNYAVQKIIDRIIFLRIGEDRDIEPYQQLKNILAGTDVYVRLVELFHRADDRYNSGLFHFRQEKGRAEARDTLTPDLRIDDRVLRDIIGNLYYPESPYEFSVLGADILGNVYEQFLGSVIRLTPAHRAVVEQKPEVRKAGGVYYTPKYIVDYIVEHTVGELCRDRTPTQIARLRILDPACGSGSFLLGAYEYLLRYHLDWYVAHPTKRARKEVYQGEAGEWFLTTEEKKRILLNNIYGVDIDSQAVEVTKLSLLLKVLEGETAGTLGQTMRMWQERALPDLAHNIKCGNSLIGPDFYDGRQMALLDEEEVYRINPFDWQAEFPEIMGRGGFDAVIGNPPYVRVHRVEKEAKDYYKGRFVSAFGAYDVYILFMEKGLELVRDNGTVGLITPNKYFVADYAKKLRHHLLTNASIAEIADLGKCRSVFGGALISTAVTFFTKAQRSKRLNLKVLSDDNVRHIADMPAKVVHLDDIVTDKEVIRIYQTTDVNRILSRLSKGSEPLSDVAQVRTGVMGFDYWAMDKYISDTNEGRRIATNSYVDRYAFLWGKKVRLYKRSVFEPRLAPGCDVLSDNTLDLFAQKKIVVRGVARRLTATLDEEGVGILVAVHSVIGKRNDNKFLVALLNSKLFNWIHLIQFYSARIPEGSLRYPISFLSQLPIRTIDFDDRADVARHDGMVSLVERMLALHKELAAAKTPTAKTMLQRQIDATDRQIDRLVYELYNLTEEEIAIVEEATT